MSQAQTRTTTKSGTSKTALAAEVAENNATNQEAGVTREELNAFLAKVAECEWVPGQPQPEIEVPRKLIEHVNRKNMDNFDQTHYFVYHNVRVYEEGKRDMSKQLEKMSLEDRVFGGYRR